MGAARAVQVSIEHLEAVIHEADNEMARMPGGVEAILQGARQFQVRSATLPRPLPGAGFQACDREADALGH